MEKDLDAGRICRETAAILENPARLHTLEKNIAAFAVPDANEIIFREISALAGKKKGSVGNG